MSEPSASSAPPPRSTGVQKALLVVFVWVGVLLGIPLLLTIVLAAFGVGRAVGTAELTIVLLAQLVLGLWLTRRVLRAP